MGTLSDQYREMAARARSDADATPLPKVRELHLRSAQRFDQIAQEIEDVADAKARNDAAKVSAAVEDKAINERLVELMRLGPDRVLNETAVELRRGLIAFAVPL